MSDLILPGKPDLSGKPKPQQIKASVMFQDSHYTIMRNTDAITTEDVLNLPLHLVLIACGMLDAKNYVPKIGKANFLATMKKLKKQFDDNYHKQKAIAEGMKDLAKPAAKPFKGGKK